MAETDTILQLGIEAAREGNREEARNLFNLVTRQDPENAQGWLWLAGVADSPDERRGALERVVALEPNNEMAVRGLQSLGVDPAGVAPARAATVSAPRAVEVPPPPVAPVRAQSAEELYADELDSAFDDYDTVEKVAPAPREYEPTPISDEPGTERVRMQPRRTSTRRADASDPLQPRRWLFLALIALCALAVLFLWIIPNWRNRNSVAVNNDPGSALVVPTAGNIGLDSTNPLTDTTPIAGTDPISATNPVSGTAPISSTDPGQPQPTVGADPAQPPAPQAPPPAAATDAELASANPQPVGVGEQLSANGYTFTYPNANYTAVLGKQVGGSTAQGNYIVVLAQVSNTTGTPASIPANYFVLKDAQGRVYSAQPQVSSAYVRRGVNADLSQEDAVPADGLAYSVPLIFDVQPGATNLVLFARGNTGQGFQVLNAAP